MKILRCVNGISVLLLVYLSLFGFSAIGDETRDDAGDEVGSVTEESGPTVQELLQLMADDRALGNRSAPAILIEYASFSCSHCADFAVKVFPKIKSHYIDKGKLLYVFRDFPIDKLSLSAAMLGSCYKEDKQFFAYVKAVFNSFEALIATYKDLGLLSNIAKISNISDEEFKRCTTDPKLMDGIIQRKFWAVKKLDINATPVFFINGRQYTGAHDFDSISEEIERSILLNPNYSAR